MSYYNIPERLRQPKSKVYCCHRNKKPTHGTKPDKLPTFFSFEEALRIMEPDEGLGIGIWGELCGIDIDHCIEDGVISPQAQLIIDYFDSYAELSLSGTGVHILFLCKEEDQYKDSNKYYVKMQKKHLEDIGGMEGLEFYQGFHDHRYLTLTGKKIHDMNTEFVSGEQVREFLEAFMTRPVNTITNPVEFTSSDAEDQAWIKWALLELKQSILMYCWFRTPTGYGGTESEDDLSFLRHLAFWCNKNPRVMRAVFESSRYYKAKDAAHIKKWARSDYSDRTIALAIVSTNTVVKVKLESTYKYDAELNKIVRVIDNE